MNPIPPITPAPIVQIVIIDTHLSKPLEKNDVTIPFGWTE